MTLGFADLREARLHALWDAETIQRVRLAEGATFDELLRDIQTALTAFNDELLRMPHYGDLVAVQDEPVVEYPIGGSTGVEEATEYAAPTPVRGKMTGHTLPLKAYQRALGWTMRYLSEARRARLDSDIRRALQDARESWQRHILQRFFNNAAERVGNTAGASVPFADGGASDPNYVPLTGPDGQQFNASHSHFLRLAALDAAALRTAVAHLEEHGHRAPFDVIAARADASTWTGLTGFKAPEWGGIVYRMSDRAQLDETSDYYGYIETDFGVARLWFTARLPTGYFGVFKTYGPNDPRNPLRVRVNPNAGFGWQIVPGQWVNAPTYMAVLYSEYGVGVGEDRTAGVCVRIAASGNYTPPAIS